MVEGLSEAIFVSAQRRTTFEADDRLDMRLLLLTAEAWNYLDKSLEGLPLNWDAPDVASRILLVYFAARVHGSTVGGSMLVAHRLGREAIIMARAQYEYFLKMIYFDHYPERARDVMKSLDVHDFCFWRQVGSDLTSRWSAEQIKAFEDATVGETDFAAIMESLKRDRRFFKAQESNPFALWFFKNFQSSYRVHWVYGSTVVHASPVDINNVVTSDDDKNLIINVDSRMKAPNLTVADLAQRCFSAAGLIRMRFDREMGEDAVDWARRFQETVAEYEDEPVDVRSMHD